MILEDQHQAFAKHVFLGEIEYQSQFAARAAEHLQTCADNFDPIEIWSAVQSILIAAGNVSKILWPPRSRSAPRGAMLRALLDIDENNAISDRNFRNHFEHYDERIEDWLSSTHSAVYVDQIIGPPPGLLRDFPQNAHRGYDPSTQTLSFRGESMNLESILRALDEIRQKCRLITQV
jgi:hypothetical protein